MMKRSRLTRRTPLRSDPERVREWRDRSRSELDRTSPIRAVNPERRAKRFRREFGSRERADLISCEPCVVPGCRSKQPSHGHHEPSRAAGGTWRDVTPLCPDHHEQVHRIGRETFQRRHEIDLRETNDHYARRFPVQGRD